MPEEAEIEEKPTPPVPPTDFNRYDDPTLTTRVIDREKQRTACPICRRELLFLIERRTGHRIHATWPADTFDEDEFRLEDDWPEVESLEKCSGCGYERRVA